MQWWRHFHTPGAHASVRVAPRSPGAAPGQRDADFWIMSDQVELSARCTPSRRRSGPLWHATSHWPCAVSGGRWHDLQTVDRATCTSMEAGDRHRICAEVRPLQSQACRGSTPERLPASIAARSPPGQRASGRRVGAAPAGVGLQVLAS